MEREDGTDLGYSYDAARRVTAIEATNLAAGLVGTTDQSFAYDGLGRRTRALDENTTSTTSDDVVTTWYYDTLGRQVEETLTFGTGTTRVVSRNYDEDGLAKLVYPNNRAVNYTRFVDGATHTIYNDGESGTPIAEYDYIGGRTLRRAMKNGIAFDMRDGSGTYYDDLGRPLRWAHLNGSTVKIGFEYSYDQAGNRLQQRNLHDPLDSQRFAYDSSGRRVSASRGDYPSGSVSQGGSLYCDAPTTATWTDQRSAFQWILDGAGNWDRYDTVIDSTLTSQTRTDTNFNEIYQVGGATLEHNDNGDLTDDGSQHYTWDPFGRLREVRSTTGTLIASYFYDADHRRVRKDLTSGTDLDILFSGWRAIEYRDASTQSILVQIVHGNYLDEALCLDTYSGGSIISTDYYHQNALYSVYGISNALGIIVVGYEYDPYGGHVLLTDGNDYDPAVNFNSNDTRTASGALSVVNLTFTGQTFDPESGLLYYKRRYYHPALGRFISRDPRGEKDGPNTYQYGTGNCLRYVDPFGLNIFDLIAKIRGKQIPKAVGVTAGGLIGMGIPETNLRGMGAASALMFFPDSCEIAAYSVRAGVVNGLADFHEWWVTGKHVPKAWYEVGGAGTIGAGIEIARYRGDSQPGNANATSFEGIFHTLAVGFGIVTVAPYEGDPNSFKGIWQGASITFGPGISGMIVNWNYVKMGALTLPKCLCYPLILAT